MANLPLIPISKNRKSFLIIFSILLVTFGWSQKYPTWATSQVKYFEIGNTQYLNDEGVAMFCKITGWCYSRPTPFSITFGSFSNPNAHEAILTGIFADAVAILSQSVLIRMNDNDEWEYVQDVPLSGPHCLTYKTVDNTDLLVCEDDLASPDTISSIIDGGGGEYYGIELYDIKANMSEPFSLFYYLPKIENLLCDSANFAVGKSYLYDFDLVYLYRSFLSKKLQKPELPKENPDKLILSFREIKISESSCFENYVLTNHHENSNLRYVTWEFDHYEGSFSLEEGAKEILALLESNVAGVLSYK